MARTDKKQQIMLAAEKLFSTRRFHELTLDDVAHEAKVGKGTIYLYFENKDDLFFQTATSGLEELCELLKRVPQNVSFLKALLAACKQISDFFEERHQLFRMMNDEDIRLCFTRDSIRERWLKKRKLLEATVAAIMQRGIEEGQIRGDIHVEVLANYLLGMLRTRAHDLIDAPKEMRGHDVIVDLFCNGSFAGKSEKNLPEMRIAP